MTNRTEQEFEIDIRELLEFLRERWIILTGITLVGTLLCFVYVHNNYPPIYHSKARLIPVHNSLWVKEYEALVYLNQSQKEGSSIFSPPTPEQLLQGILSTLNSITAIQILLDDEEIASYVQMLFKTQLIENANRDFLIEELRELIVVKVSVGNNPKSVLHPPVYIEVGVGFPDRKIAQKVVQMMIDYARQVAQTVERAKLTSIAERILDGQTLQKTILQKKKAYLTTELSKSLHYEKRRLVQELKILEESNVDSSVVLPSQRGFLTNESAAPSYTLKDERSIKASIASIEHAILDKQNIEGNSKYVQLSRELFDIDFLENLMKQRIESYENINYPVVIVDREAILPKHPISRKLELVTGGGVLSFCLGIIAILFIKWSKQGNVRIERMNEHG